MLQTEAQGLTLGRTRTGEARVRGGIELAAYIVTRHVERQHHRGKALPKLCLNSCHLTSECMRDRGDQGMRGK